MSVRSVRRTASLLSAALLAVSFLGGCGEESSRAGGTSGNGDGGSAAEDSGSEASGSDDQTEDGDGSLDQSVIDAFDSGEYSVAAGTDYGPYEIKEEACSGAGAHVFLASDPSRRFTDPYVAYLKNEGGWIFGTHMSYEMTALCQSYEESRDAAVKGIGGVDTLPAEMDAMVEAIKSEQPVANDSNTTFSMEYARVDCISFHGDFLISGLIHWRHKETAVDPASSTQVWGQMGGHLGTGEFRTDLTDCF